MNHSNFIKSFSPGVVAVGTPWASPEIVVRETGYGRDARRMDPRGYFSFCVTFTGAGTLQADATCTLGSVFKTPEGATSIITGKVAGGYIATFTVPVCRAFKIVLTATTANATVTECLVGMV